jgi:hypothetical protein
MRCVRKAGALLIGIFAVAGVFAAPSSAYHLTLSSCSGFKTTSLTVTKLKTNYSCAGARVDLRHLLRRGIRKLPKLTTRPGRWGCGKTGSDRVCSRYTATGKVRRVLFRARLRKTTAGSTPNSQPPPATIPPTPPAPAVLDCINRWNADPYFLSDGVHFYDPPHSARYAWVFPLAHYPAKCAVIFVQPPSDPEYTLDGYVFDSGSSVLMDDPTIPEPGWNPLEIQNAAPTHANATLDATGRLALGA